MMRRKTATRKRKYTFAEGSKLPANKAQAVGEHLHSLEATGGALTPDTLLQDAKRPTSPLHDMFEWDDTEAAMMWRLQQAAKILRSIKVMFLDLGSEQPTSGSRAYVVVQENPDEPSRYLPIQTVMADDNLRGQLLARALCEVNAWRQRYQQLNELSAVFVALDSVEGRERSGGIGQVGRVRRS